MSSFDHIIDQRNTVDEKHDQMKEYFDRDDLLPMWVAEMDFQTAPEILKALHERVDHGIFGYTFRSDSYQQALLRWYAKRHHVQLSIDMIAYDTGVLKGIFELLRIFTNERDRVLVPVPAYPQFEKVISLANREMVAFPLQERQHRYYFDFSALQTALHTCRVMLVCSPHNPGGRIWQRQELEELVRICKEEGVLLIGDEIHSDLTMPGKTFTSLLELDEQCIVLNSISKPFNLAGLQHSYCICQNKQMAKQIAEHYHKYKIKSMNTLSMVAQEHAYTKGVSWLLECCTYIKENEAWIRAFLKEHGLHIPVFELEAGYLLWMDFSTYFHKAQDLDDFLVDTCHLATSAGRTFDERCGCFTRLNIATPRVNCETAMKRIYEGCLERGLL